MPRDGAQDFYFQHIESLLLFAVLALLLNAFAKAKGFYTLSPRGAAYERSLKLKNVAVCFGIYIGYSLVLAPLLARALRWLYQYFFPYASTKLLSGWFQFLIVSLTLISLLLYGRAQERSLMKKIWKDYSLPQASSPFYDWFLGVLTWLLGFPVVVVVGQLADMLVYYLFGVESYEQVAVRYLKSTLGSPSLLVMALFTILLAAPIIEEFLFRGMLQTWIKKHLGTKAAILLAGLCFALFHIAPSQGLGNIPLTLSLFSFACFLGFIYERQGSLFASIGLHMTFNAVTTFRILFSTDA